MSSSPSLRARETSALELMDDPDCDVVALDRTYRHFALVNCVVSGWRRIYERRIRPLATASPSPLTVLDIGSGGGDVARALAAWSRRDGHPISVTAIDPDPRAHAFALSLPPDDGVRYERTASRALVEEGRVFDVVVSNHVLHHLAGDELTALLDDSRVLARRLAIHNDIARSRTAYAAYSAVTRVGFAGSFIRPDGLLSIRRSYTPAELRSRVSGGWRVERLQPARLLLTLSPGDADA
ncbi:MULTISPECIES: class I SAM-dependent methyltransferase [unclassified Frondihabitans]|uniref:class I SAM-dependent methyltransferase n=1 Tax=unclassified Frondihabitans TaxID=2626248 RepID=UPI000FAF8006|nr:MULTISPECIES: class I SAM-dependent methyltransferase [unclassified Frondihabitans]RPE78890.1 2-polyprenyl-3-methyl-5-hydroxy-6-metoxy-1,4-benzoquinol methylase [Frondihabitans sp. PhB153]RPF09171.1 2-polyprenyl-3-methyl-5-hydroxy-6-metoxy-1,4-benzoquinol methylase [Frondihabitans sp. PhB161]